MPNGSNGPGHMPCPRCSADIAPGLLTCPACQFLVHGRELEQLAKKAAETEQAGDLSRALASWRAALELLPSDSRQHQSIADRVTSLSKQVDASAPDKTELTGD